mmetsp:Transcript_30328/g.68922  ORF Transcript_30328/g.68922 Transcript_30328/m.68922 type:complete len:105 (+) Transcript_30328:70-384(+)
MSGFSFIDDEVSEVNKARNSLSGFDRSAARKPPAAWGAAKSKSVFEETAYVADAAGPQGGAQGGAQGGGSGPSLPFRIREIQMVPKAVGTQPVFCISKPQLKTE